MTTPASSIADAMKKMSTTGKSADRRSRGLLTVGQVVNVKIERGPASEPDYRPGFIATVRVPFHWTDNEGRIKYGLIPDVQMSAPVAIGDMVVLETIGRGFAATYIGSPAVQPMPLHVSGLVSLPSFQLAAQGPGGAVQWYRRLGRFSVRGESSAFIASAAFDSLNQSSPVMTSRLPATVPVNVARNSGTSHTHTSEAVLDNLNTVLQGGVIYNSAIPFAVRLAALGPYDTDGEPVRPSDAGAAWILGEAGAGQRGAIVNPGHIGVRGNPDLAVSFDAAFDVGAEGAGRKYDLYLLVSASSVSTYTALRMRLNVLEAAWNTDYERTLLDYDGG